MINLIKAKPETKGYLTLVLHAHLPYIRHFDRDDYMEERWFYEAMTETYLPLAELFGRLICDRVDFRITMSLTPTLLALCSDPLMQERYAAHLDRLIRLAEQETVRLRKQPAFRSLAEGYADKFQTLKRLFLDCGGNIASKFRHYQELGKLEIITCAATHGFLPLMKTEEAIRAQIAAGAEDYERHFGCAPRGIWLPECGYTPGIDRILKQYGIDYFFVDSSAVEYATPRPNRELYAPLMTPYGVTAFPRDPESSEQVWSASVGYPGDYDYREYYRDIGWDLGWHDPEEWDYIRPYVLPTGERVNTGIKYYRITGKGSHREPYNPAWAKQKAAQHADDFLFKRQRQAEHWHRYLDRRPIIVAPYDAELFGHWWYEGPLWLELLCRKIFHDQHTIRMITPSEYLREYPVADTGRINESSWGRNHSAEVWLSGNNDWIYRHLHEAEERMVRLATRHRDLRSGTAASRPASARRHEDESPHAPPSAASDRQGDEPSHEDASEAPLRHADNPPHTAGEGPALLERALNQAARELLLAQSSDWAFIMDSRTVVDYAVRRTKDHLGCFRRLCDQIEGNGIDARFLSVLEMRDNCFPAIDYRDYAAIEPASPVAIVPDDESWRQVLAETGGRPNIFMLVWEYPPKNVGGLSPAVSQLSEALAAQGECVHVVTTSHFGAPYFEKRNGVYVHRLPVLSSGDTDFFDWTFEMNLAMVDHLVRWKENGGRIDVLHAHDWMVLHAAREIKHSYGIPLIATVHATEWGRNQGRLDSDLQHKIHRLEWKLCYEARKVFVCSEYMRNEIRSIFQLPDDKIEVFPNGIGLPLADRFPVETGAAETGAPDRRSATPPDRDPARGGKARFALPHEKIVFCIGRLVFEKGVHVLIDAIPRVLQQVPDAKFIVGGSGPMQDELMRRAAPLGERVLFTGFIDNEVRDQIYEAADVCVVPSLYEPFGIVALEAMKYGKPVVVSDTGGLAEIVEHGVDGYKALPGDIESLAWHIADLLARPELGRKMAEAAYRKLREHYQWSGIARRMRGVYDGLAGGERVRPKRRCQPETYCKE